MRLFRRVVIGKSFDMALSRAWQFKEAQRFEFRAEAYNVTNSFRPLSPSASQNNQFFGLIEGTTDIPGFLNPDNIGRLLAR